MGFDVTFHPIGAEQLQHFLFDVVDDPAKAESRAKEISNTKKYQTAALKLYGQMPAWLADNEMIGPTFAFAAAILAGFLHPYWYARGQALTFLAEEHAAEAAELFVPLGKVVPSKLSALPDRKRAMIFGNESASGFIPPDRIKRAVELLDNAAKQPGRGGLSKLETIFDDDGLEALRSALDYCLQHQLGMIEASDVVVPIANQCISDSSHLRAKFIP